jgi:hypothetical protein
LVYKSEQLLISVLSPTFLTFRRILKNYNLQFNVSLLQKHLKANKSKKRAMENITTKGDHRDTVGAVIIAIPWTVFFGGGWFLSRSQGLEIFEFLLLPPCVYYRMGGVIHTWNKKRLAKH